MPNLFDLPFETEPDSPEVRPASSPAALPASPSAAGAPVAPPVAGPPTRPSVPEPRVPPAVRPERVVFSVSQLNAAIRDELESGFPEVWVEGEVSNCRPWSSGLVYFTLKDSSAQLKVVMFRTAAARLRFALQDGMSVLARGQVSVYEPRGEYQLVCQHVEPRGLGALQLAFEQLKKKLAAEGLFSDARKRALPLLPRKIGIVTSMDGAALRDIVRVITSRHARVHLVIRSARVQGEGAAEDIARGLRAIARVPGVDVVIVGRGGGSIEDLWAFNEELVARAIAKVPVPVISAVGHEVDWTIADFVADVRAATPSNAAELVVARSDEFCASIDRRTDALRAAFSRALDRRRNRVHVLTSRRGLASVPLRVASHARRADDLSVCLERAVRGTVQDDRRQVRLLQQRLAAKDPVRRLGELRTRWTRANGRLTACIAQRLQRGHATLATVVARLDSLSPLAVLGRGYALCWSADGRTLHREARPELAGSEVRVMLARGSLLCDVRVATPDRDHM